MSFQDYCHFMSKTRNKNTVSRFSASYILSVSVTRAEYWLVHMRILSQTHLNPTITTLNGTHIAWGSTHSLTHTCTQRQQQLYVEASSHTLFQCARIRLGYSQHHIAYSEQQPSWTGNAYTYIDTRIFCSKFIPIYEWFARHSSF